MGNRAIPYEEQSDLGLKCYLCMSQYLEFARQLVLLMMSIFKESGIPFIKYHKSEFQIGGGIEDNSKIIFLISQQKHML